MTSENIYRVTVRGRFNGLDEKSRAFLTREQPEHDIFKSAFTAEGTFTYDKQIQFFNLRYEIRTPKDSEGAGSIGREEAETFLRTLGLPHFPLKVNVVDVAQMWRG